MRVKLGVVVCMVLSVLAITGAAFANPPVPYWGFNYLSSTNPDADDCAIDSYRACSGQNYWDRSQMDKRNGGYATLAFLSADGWSGTNQISGIGVWYINRGDYGGLHYNRVMCDYYSGNQSYAQCQAVIV